MERIKALARLAAMIAVVIFLSTWVSWWYSESESSQGAYEQLNTHMKSIQAQMDENQTYVPLMSEEAFRQDFSQEEVSAYIDTWVMQALGEHRYSQEIIEEVKTEILGLYESQRELAKDQTYHHYVNIVRGVTLTVIVLALVIAYLIKQKQGLKK